MTISRLRNSLLLSSLLIMLACAAWASVTGSISGQVTDPAGAAIPGVSVTATNVQTGVAQTVTTNTEGYYSFLALPVGNYTLTARYKGFKDFKTTNIVLNVNQTLRTDIKLQVGEVTQQVVVTETAVQVQTADTQMGDVINSSKITSMPLNGRSYIDLLGLQPGVVPISSGLIGGDRPVSGDLGAGNLSVSGQRESSNGFMVNGGNIEEGRNMGAAIVPNLDSIDQFRLLTNSADAEYGNYSGGLVNVITKSGTNQFHGDAFEFLRNEHLDARGFFDPTRARFRRNQFGGTFGGPIVRDKIFFFGDYQGTYESEGVSTGLIPVPSAADRAGNVSDIASQLGGTVGGSYWAGILSSELGYTVTAGEPYYTPGCTSSSACVFPNAQIPASAISAPAKALMKYIPLPNVGTNFSSAAQNKTVHDNKGSFRVDGESRWGRLSAYYDIDNSLLNDPYPAATLPGFNAITPGRAQQLVLSDTKAYGATAVNEFRFSFMRDANIFRKPVGGLGPTLSSLGFVEGFTTPGGIGPIVPQYEGVPLLWFNNYALGIPDGTTGQYNNTFQWLDNFSKVIGTHEIKFGGQYHYDQINERNTYAENGVFGFYGSETGSDFIDFLLGAPASLIQSSRQFLDSRTQYAGAFAQDRWRATRDLTVNYGLRWEFSTPWYDTQGKIETIVPGEQSIVFPGAPRGWLVPGDPGIPKTLSPIRYKNFGPRLGLAYAPSAGSGPLHILLGDSGQSSIRAAWGLYYTAIEDLTQFIEVGDAPYGLFYVSPAPPLFATPYIDRATGNSEGQRFPFQFPPLNVGPNNPDRTFNWPQVEPISGSPAFATNNRLPYAEHYNVSYERQLSKDTLLSFSYVGTQSHRLISSLEANPGNPGLCLSLSQLSQVAPGSPTCGPFGENVVYTYPSGKIVNSTRGPLGPLFGSDAYMTTMANSNYNSFETSVRHTSGRLSLLAGYTYAKSMDDASGLGDAIDPMNFKVSKGLSAFDMTHNFVVSYNWELPFDHFLGKRRTRGWIWSGVTRFTTGLPVGLGENDDASLLGTSGVDLPNVVPGNLSVGANDPRTGQPWFNPNLFFMEGCPEQPQYAGTAGCPVSVRTFGQLGNANRRFFHGPGLENFDMALMKNVKLTENKTLEFRGEFFNVFNHAQFRGPQGNINNSNFGLVTSAYPPRIGQLGVKFIF